MSRPVLEVFPAGDGGDDADDPVRRFILEQRTRDDAARWLLALDDETFRVLVGEDCHERLDREAWAALRHPLALRRWQSMLRLLRVDGKAQVAAKQCSPADEFAEWRRKYTRWDERLRARLVEVDHLISEQRRAHGKNWEKAALGNAGAQEQAARQAAGGEGGAQGEDRISNKTRKCIAGDKAIERLIAAHRDEFSRLYDEEYTVLGTPAGIRARAGRLVRAGVSPRIAEVFAQEMWPAGEIAPGVRLEVQAAR